MAKTKITNLVKAFNEIKKLQSIDGMEDVLCAIDQAGVFTTLSMIDHFPKELQKGLYAAAAIKISSTYHPDKTDSRTQAMVDDLIDYCKSRSPYFGTKKTSKKIGFG